MKTENQNLTADEKILLTLRLVRNTLYNAGICQKLYTYAYHAEQLITDAKDTELREEYDALDAFRDFMARAKNKSLKHGDVTFIYEKVQSALKSNQNATA
jgi:hypothetical protein